MFALCEYTIGGKIDKVVDCFFLLFNLDHLGFWKRKRQQLTTRAEYCTMGTAQDDFLFNLNLNLNCFTKNIFIQLKNFTRKNRF